MDLFSSDDSTEKIKLDLPDSDISYFPHFFSSEKASDYFKVLKSETEWQQDTITLYGQSYLQPRLTALYGDNEKHYTYSGITMFPKPFSSTLLEIKSKIEVVSETKYNVVLLNLYRHGNDSIGWHSDDEKELGKDPNIASVSFGAERMFHLKHNKEKISFKIKLENGSLLLMKGATQHFWKHQIPKSKKINQLRINLTFRRIN